MLKFVVTIEYVNGNETKLILDSFQRVREWIDPRLDSDWAARQVKRVSICPVDQP